MAVVVPEPPGAPLADIAAAGSEGVGAEQFARLQRVHVDAASAPLGLEWRDIRFAMGEREILAGVSGRLPPGHLTGVMGPSGGGKTTLLNVLSGRQRRTGTQRSSGSRQRIACSGEVTICGRPAKQGFIRKKIAYVFQDLALMETETPRECLDFSANLRLPRSVTPKERREYVDGMLRHLRLEHCADTCVGSSLNKGLSGGEQKRVAIGVELISNPKIMFLDEPLSGLDSYNAYTLVRSLKTLALAGVPMLMTLHQPSSEIFAEFEDMLVLHGGEVIYHGPAGQLADHFERAGIRCPSRFNPSDFVMFTMAKSSNEEVQLLKTAWLGSEAYKNLLHQIALSRANGEGNENEDDSSDYGSSVSSDTDGMTSDGGLVGHHRTIPREHRRTCLEALRVLAARDFRGAARQLHLYLFAAIIVLLVAVVYGSFFYRAGYREDQHCLPENFDSTQCQATFAAHLAVTQLIALNMMIVSLQMAIDILHKDRSVFLREKAAGFYTALPSFTSKGFFELVVGSVNSLFCLCGTYWLVGLRAPFFALFLEVELMILSTSSIMYCLSASCSTRDQAASLATLPQVLQFAFSGLLVPINLIPASLRWIRWICPLYYGVQMVAATEFAYVYDDIARCQSEFGDEWKSQCAGAVTRRGVLEVHGFQQDDFLTSLVALCVLLLVFRTLALIILSKKTKFAV